MADYVILSISDNSGYSPEQVKDQSISLGDLLEAVQQAIEDNGADAKIVLANGQRYGASYGHISPWEDLFEVPEEDESEDDEYLRP